MNARAICTGRFSLPLAVEKCEALFTPEGDRRWAGSSWDPIYAIPEAVEDDSAPGTVFTTESDGGMATWIVLERREDGMRYARVAPTASPARSTYVSARHVVERHRGNGDVRRDLTRSRRGGVRQGPRGLLR
jgi:hypothetical protein